MPLIGETRDVVYSTQEMQAQELEELEQAEREQEWIDQQEQETARLDWLLREERESYYDPSWELEDSIDPRED